jgi:hypothetical protein
MSIVFKSCCWSKFKDNKFEESTSWDKFSKFNISENHQVNAEYYFMLFMLHDHIIWLMWNLNWILVKPFYLIFKSPGEIYEKDFLSGCKN